MRVLKAQWRTPWFCCREFERPARDLTNPKGPLELEARQPAQVVPVPVPEGRVLGILSHDPVLHYSIAKVINYRRDGKYPAKAFVQTLLRRVLRGGCDGKDGYGHHDGE